MMIGTSVIGLLPCEKAWKTQRAGHSASFLGFVTGSFWSSGLQSAHLFTRCALCRAIKPLYRADRVKSGV